MRNEECTKVVKVIVRSVQNVSHRSLSLYKAVEVQCTCSLFCSLAFLTTSRYYSGFTNNHIVQLGFTVASSSAHVDLMCHCNMPL